MNKFENCAAPHRPARKDNKMTENYSVALSKIIDEFSLEKVFLPDDSDDILVHLTEVNRPGLQLAGFFDHFEPQRIQIIGKVEHKYLEFLSDEERRSAIMGFLQTKPVAVVFSSNLEVFPEFTELGEYFEVPILRTPETTSAFMAALIASLSGKPNSTASTTVKKIPNCAAPPNSSMRGLLSRGPKSIIAPMPTNRSSGKASDAAIPFS